MAGAIFGVEVLVLGKMFYDVLFPSFLSGIVAYHVALQFGETYPHDPLPLMPLFTAGSIFEILLLGVWCGLVALFLIECMKFADHCFERSKWHWSLTAGLGGLLLVCIGYFVSPSYLGLGLDTLEKGFHGEILAPGAVFWKSIATSITLGSGGSGGVVTPIFYIGTSAGNLFAQLLSPKYIAAYSAIGMVAVLSGAANTPIAASVMAIELFGAQMAPYTALACMVSFLISGYRSIYPSQILGIQKSSSLEARTGIPISEIATVTLKRRKRSIMAAMEKIAEKRRKHKKDGS